MAYMKKILGPKFIKINVDAIGVSLRNALAKYNIDVRRKSRIDGMILTMMYITEDQ